MQGDQFLPLHLLPSWHQQQQQQQAHCSGRPASQPLGVSPKANRRLDLRVAFHQKAECRNLSFNFPSFHTSFNPNNNNNDDTLAGFLPYIDDEDQNGPAATSSSGSGGGGVGGRKRHSPARFNHAIWDQIGLLHWLKRNVQAFGGDPANVTLLAADERGSLYVQLLCVSPPAKGLFGRAILLQRQRACSPTSSPPDSNKELPMPTPMDLGRLMSEQSHQNNAEMRRRLSIQLAEIVLETNSTQNRQPANAYEALLEADIRQLALIERQLKRKSSQKMLLLLEEPSLDDMLLFPHLNPLIDHMRGSSANQLISSLRSELNYCAYIKRIYLAARAINPIGNPFEVDPLQLLPLSAATSLNHSHWITIKRQRLSNDTGGWHREPASDASSADRKPADSQLRSVAVQYFHHLNQLSSLNDFLLASSNQPAPRLTAADEPADIAEHDDDELDNPDRKQNRALRRRAVDASLRHSQTAADKRATAAGELQSIEDTNHLAGLLSAVDLMFGYISCSGSAGSASQLDDRTYYYGAGQSHSHKNTSNFSRLAGSLLSWAASGNSSDVAGSLVDNNLLAWFKWIDFHSILSAAGRQQCEFSSLLSSSSSSLNETSPTSSNSFIFMLNEPASGVAAADSPADWSLLHRTLQNADATVQSGLRSFIKYGHTGSGNSAAWPSYNTLSREFQTIGLEESTQKSLRNQMRVLLDLVPYLEDDRLSGELASLKSSDNLKSPLHDAYNCLNELELRHGHNRKLCLSNPLARLRGLTRRYAAQDLRPLIASLGETNQVAKSSQMWEFGPEKSSGPSVITTRNLVNQLSDMEDVAAPSDEQDQHSLIVTNGTTSSGHLIGRQAAASASASSNGNDLLKRLLGLLALKGTTAGRALTIVVVAGLVIFVVNLIIVLAMTLRSSSRRRAQPTQPTQRGGAGGTTTSNKVFDSPGVELAAKSILMHKQHSAGEPDDCYSSSSPSSMANNNNANSTTMKLASSLRKDPNDRRYQSDAASSDKQTTISQTTRASKQLKFKLADEQNESDFQLEQASPASGDDLFQLRQQQQQQQQMIELTDLMMARGDEDTSEILLSASPLMEASQFLVAAEYPHQHQRHLQHERHSNDCKIHHHAFQDTASDQYHVVTAAAETSRDQDHPAIQSPFNQASSLASNSNATGTNSCSSTFRQSSTSLRLTRAPTEPHFRQQQPHQHFQGVQHFCNSHSPNSSTTPSVTPNQHTESSLVYSAQQQFAPDSAPYYHQHHHHHDHHHLDAFEQILVAERIGDSSEQQFVQTLRRQHKFPPSMSNGPNHNQAWQLQQQPQ